MQTIRLYVTITVLLCLLLPNYAQAQLQKRPILRLIYFIPRDRQAEPNINADMDRVIKKVQQHYAEHMERLGYGKKTFQIETDRNGKAVVHHVKGKFNDAHYRFDTFHKISDEISKRYDTSKNVYFVAANTNQGFESGVDGRALVCGLGGHFTLVRSVDECFTTDYGFLVAAHELGHTFGLQHDFRDNSLLMSYGGGTNLSACDAEWLDVHRTFNLSRPAANKSATINMLPPRLAAPPNAIRFRFKVTDPEGIHQARLHTITATGLAVGFPEVVACKELNGKPNTTIELITTHLTAKHSSVSLQVIDVNGNYTHSQRFSVNIASLLPRSKVVSIPDANLAAAVRQEIGSSTTTQSLLNLTRLDARNRGIRNLRGLEHAHNLQYLNLGAEFIDGKGLVNSNRVSDLSPLVGLKQLTQLHLSYNTISNVSVLSKMTQLVQLDLGSNAISDISPLVRLDLPGTQWDNTGLYIWGNPLSYASIYTHIPAMQAKGIGVKFFYRTPTTLVKISGDAQQGTANTALQLPLVVEVRDGQNLPFPGVPVAFTVPTGNGKLSNTTTTTDATGRAKTHLTLGQTAGATRVRVSAAKISQSVQFTAKTVLLTTPVAVSDTALRVKIAETLGKPRGSSITVSDMLKLTALVANSANIRDLTGLEHAANLTTLSLNNNDLSDITPLASLPELTSLSLNNNKLQDGTPLAGLSQLKTLSLNNNDLSDTSNLTGLRRLKTLHLQGNLLNYPSLYTHIPTLQSRGVRVTFTPRTPTTLVKISTSRGIAGATLLLIVEVQDENGLGFAGVPVTFTVTAGGGRLSRSNTITGSHGETRTTLTLGAALGNNTVRTTTPKIQRPVIFTITAINANSTVTIPDTNLRAKIAETLGKSPNAPLTAGNMMALTKLNAPNANIRNLTGLEHAHNLRELHLGGEYVDGKGNVNSNTIRDFSPILGLTQLINLNLTAASLTDVSFLSELTQLQWLHLGNNKISDISALARLTQLTLLYLDSNPITDAAPLAGLKQLEALYLSYTNVSDISSLAGLIQLKILYLYNASFTNVSALSGLKQLTNLGITSTFLPDISPLAGLTQLTFLNLSDNEISDISALAELTQLTILYIGNNRISDVFPLSKLTQLRVLSLTNNAIRDVSPLVGLNLTGTQWNSKGLYLRINPLSHASIKTHIPAMQAKGVTVEFDNRAHPTLLKISGDAQENEVGTTLENPFVVEAQDKNGDPMQGVDLTFTVIAGGGNQAGIVAPIITTDANGRAQTTLTLGQTVGTNIVTVTGNGLPELTFTATATESTRPTVDADVNGDGVVDDQDIDAVSAQFGQQGKDDADVNGDGVVNIADLLLVAGVIGGDAGAPALYPRLLSNFSVADIQQWLDEAKRLEYTDTAYLRGIAVLEHILTLLLPRETALLTNYPNPFNPETWIPYQLAESAEVTLHIYAVNGKLVWTLALGHRPAGRYQTRSRAAYWDGRNAVGETVASGIYFYTLTADNFTATRKMLIRK